MKRLERLPQETDRGYALRTIKDNIISLDLAPGAQISENELASKMGLSRTPVREALMELAKVKIIKVVPQKRSTVAMIDYDLVEEARFLRNVLECAVVELVCQTVTEPDLMRMDENLRLQRFYMNSDHQMLMELDDQFHGLLFASAQKSQIFEMMQNMLIHFDRVRRMALESVKDIKIVEDHEKIAAAIRERDPDKAKELMQMHLSRFRVDAKDIREKYPQYFLH